MGDFEMCIEGTGTWILLAGQILRAIVLRYIQRLNSHCTDRDSLEAVAQERTGSQSLCVLQRL